MIKQKTMQEIIVEFITDYYKKNQFYPNYDEIAAGVDRSKSVIYTHMKKLEGKGIIVRKTDRSSQYRLPNMDLIYNGRHRARKPETKIQNEDVKVGHVTFKAGTKTYWCPSCKKAITGTDHYCRWCGQAIEL